MSETPIIEGVGSKGLVRQVSSVLRALDVLADPWAFLVLRECFFGIRRFDDFQPRLQIARSVLSERLEHLLQEGVLARVRYQARPPRDEYRLTEAGRDFYPAIVALMAWGDRWHPAEGGPPLALFSGATGRPLRPAVVCAACGQPVAPRSVVMQDGPGAGSEEVAVLESKRRSQDLAVYTRGRPCSVASTLSVIGDRWSFRVLRAAFFGIKRFDNLQSGTGASRNILAGRLKHLVAAGVLRRQPYQERPARFEYVLTPSGLELHPIFLLLLAWGDRWRRPEAGIPLLITHSPCGAALQPVLADLETGRPITAAVVTYQCRYDTELSEPGGSGAKHGAHA